MVELQQRECDTLEQVRAAIVKCRAVQSRTLFDRSSIVVVAIPPSDRRGGQRRRTIQLLPSIETWGANTLGRLAQLNETTAKNWNEETKEGPAALSSSRLQTEALNEVRLRPFRLHSGPEFRHTHKSHRAEGGGWFSPFDIQGSTASKMEEEEDPPSPFFFFGWAMSHGPSS